MPGNETEQRIAVRAFSGVDIETDPAFLPADTLQQSQNFIPQLTYLLQKRFGTTLWASQTLSNPDALPWASPRIDAMQWVLDTQGIPILFFVITTIGDGILTAKGDRLLMAKGGPVPTVSTIWNFDIGDGSMSWVSTSGGRYGMTVLGARVYVGNGINPLVVVEIESPNTVSTTAPIGDFTQAVVDPSLADTAATTGLLSGTYSFRWGYLDSSVPDESVWKSLGPTTTFVVTGTNPQAADFPGPTDADVGVTLDPTHTAHLFLSPPGFPIEYARDHGMISSSGTHLIVNALVPDSELTPLRGVAFTGRYLQRHRGRVWLAGDQTNSLQNRNRLYSTNVVVPGLEQQLYNYGDFFPALANTQIGGADGDVITGLAVIGGGANKDVAQSPLVIFKSGSIWLWFGDLVDDPTAQLVQISDRIGCVAPQTIVSTSEGVFFLGIDSVYMLGQGFMEPLDIGLPIRPAVLSIPKNLLPFACATYHRGFYKLAIAATGSTLNDQQWWLDLRPSMQSSDVGKQAKWWGPHNCTPASTMTVAILDPAEHERLYVGRQVPINETPPIAIVCTADQANVYTDLATLASKTPVVGVLRTGGLVEDDPFAWKSWAMARIVTLPDKTTPVTIATYADGGSQQSWPVLNQNTELDSGLQPDVILTESGTGIWDVSLWDEATWGQKRFVEGWSIFGTTRIRSKSLQVQLTHGDPTGILVRDLEVTFAPIQRRAPGAR